VARITSGGTAATLARSHVHEFRPKTGALMKKLISLFLLATLLLASTGCVISADTYGGGFFFEGHPFHYLTNLFRGDDD
jgi:hypothetical protein